MPASVKLSVDTVVHAHRTQLPRGVVVPMSEKDEPFNYGPAKPKQILTGDESLVKIIDQAEIIHRFVHGLLVNGNVTFIKDLYMAPKVSEFACHGHRHLDSPRDDLIYALRRVHH